MILHACCALYHRRGHRRRTSRVGVRHGARRSALVISAAAHSIELERTHMSDSPSRDERDPPLAYRNTEFLDSEKPRPLQILSEYLQPLHEFRRQQIHDTIVFFGSARLPEDGPLAHYY